MESDDIFLRNIGFFAVIAIAIAVAISLCLKSVPRSSAQGSSKKCSGRRPQKTAEQMAAEVQTRSDLNRLWAKLDREIAKEGFTSHEAAERQGELVERIQEAIEIVEKTHEWANYGEGYRPELDPPKRRKSRPGGARSGRQP